MAGGPGDVLVAAGAGRVYGNGDGVRALGGVDLTVASGEFVAVMGPSGSGKTTLLNLLGALDTPTEGEVWFEGQALGSMSDSERTEVRRHRIGFVFQQFLLLPHLTAVENVALPLVVGRSERSEREARARRMLDLVGLSHRADAFPTTLSGGEQQRVAVARALVHEPPVVLADEPTGALDSTTGLRVVSLLAEARGELGHALVVVTHDEAVTALADRVVHLRDGSVVRSDDRGGTHTAPTRRPATAATPPAGP